jgi:cytochrome c oxidase subunit 3
MGEDMAQGHAKHHDYHLVDPSPWPFTVSIGAFIMAIGAVGLMRWLKGEDVHLLYMKISNPWLMFVGLAIILYTFFGWWRDVVREGQQGHHTRVVQIHLRYGMILFIASEVMFFVAWFWAFFDVALFPGEAHQYLRAEFTHGVWPPKGIQTFDPWHLPLFNTLVLLLSGTTVTWAHHALIENDRAGLKQGLALTVALGILFTICQAIEYSGAPFGFSGNIYGATFFMATGFHGFHVIVGTIFLAVCLIRASLGHFTPKAHFGFEAAAWYWHFVDVVWLFLFVSIYVWFGGVPHHG